MNIHELLKVLPDAQCNFRKISLGNKEIGFAESGEVTLNAAGQELYAAAVAATEVHTRRFRRKPDAQSHDQAAEAAE
jgi:hypothetical protein